MVLQLTIKKDEFKFWIFLKGKKSSIKIKVWNNQESTKENNTNVPVADIYGTT